MKRPTFRLREDKHRKLMSKLTLNGKSFQDFGEYVVNLYLNDEIQIKKESEEMKIFNTGLGEKMELVTELKTRDNYEKFCLGNGAVGGCAKNKSEIRQANKARLIEMTEWICDNYKTYLEYTKGEC